MQASVAAVHLSSTHAFSKDPAPSIELVEGIGIHGDTHAGVTVQHRSRVAVDPTQPNLRQVHLIHGELLTQLAAQGHEVAPGQLGENITTAGIDLLGLPEGTRLHVADAIIEVTGLRNPCRQINDFQPGLLKKLVLTDGTGRVEKLAGIMGIVARGGIISPGDPIDVELPPEPHRPLAGV